MTVSVFVLPQDGQFCASVAGSPDRALRAPWRAEALAALEQEVLQKIATGELVNIEVPTIGLSAFAGIFADDPEIHEICKEIYRQRDAERLPCEAT